MELIYSILAANLPNCPIHVPDSGATALLLSLGVVGLGAIDRFEKNKKLSNINRIILISKAASPSERRLLFTPKPRNKFFSKLAGSFRSPRIKSTREPKPLNLKM